MKNPSRVVHALFAAVGFLFMATEASAGILGDGDRVLDTETGLEYLHSKYSWGEYPGHWLYPNSYPNTFPWTLATPPGYRPATDSEVRSLFNAVGVAPGISSSAAAYTPIDTLHTFMGHLHEVNVGRFERTSIYITGTRTPEPNDPSLRLLGYTVRVDENFNHTVRTGSIWRTDGSVNQASQSAFLVLVRNTNVSPSTPIAPLTVDGTNQSFVSPATTDLGAWYDIAAIQGLNTKISAGSVITHVGLPASFTDDDNLLVLEDPTVGTINLGPGDVHEFSSPVTMLTLTGFNAPPAGAPADGESVINLPLFLSFASPGTSFTTAAIPEPASMVLMGLGGVMLLRRRRVA